MTSRADAMLTIFRTGPTAASAGQGRLKMHLSTQTGYMMDEQEHVDFIFLWILASEGVDAAVDWLQWRSAGKQQEQKRHENERAD
jgi:hypothetical protein